MWGRRSSAIVLTAALALGTGTALAQPTANEAAARDAFDEGTRLYGESRYLDAARAYERAYELSPRPLLLRNISTAYERALDMGRAADALERYLDASNPADEADLRTRLARMREMACASSTGTAPPETTLTPPPEPVQELGPPDPVNTPPPEPRPRQIDIVEQRPETGRGTTAPQPTPSEPEPSDEGGGSPAGVISVITGGVAVVMTVVAVVSGIMAIGEGAAVTQCLGMICPPSSADGIASARTLADTSTVSGSIGAAVGIAAVILAIVALSSSGDDGERRERSALITPAEGGALGLRF